jgi:CBS domain containing-hemolysin-like protein
VTFYILVFFDLVFTAARASLINARVPYLISLREAEPEAVDRTLSIIEKPHVRLALRFWTFLCHLLLAGTGVFYFSELIGQPLELWPAIGLLICLALLLLVAELGIEKVMLQNTEAWAVRLTPLAVLMDVLVRPLTLILSSVRGTAQAQRQPGAVTEDELKFWVEDESPEGGLEKDERKMIYSIFQFGDTLCREVMVPRLDVLAFDVNTSLVEAAQTLTQLGHSRAPVYEDTIDNIIGLLYAKDLLSVALSEKKDTAIRDLLRPAYFVPEAKKVEELLREMQARGTHMAIVVDEYGGMAGLVTLEDIVEEIVGEIRDEYDQLEETLFQQVGPQEYIFLGKADLDDFNEVVGTHLTREVADTLGGFLYGELGRVPVEGEHVEVEGRLLTVEQVSGRRIRKVRVQPVPAANSKEEEQNESEH